jgi:acyl carrier protein
MSESTTAPAHAARREQIRQSAREAWAAALGEEPTDDADDFFAWGGDSVYAMSIISVLTEELGFPIPATTMLTAPTFGGFVEALAALDQQAADHA